MSVPVPTVNLNGTARSDLIQQIGDVVEALDEAIKTLQDAAPHGRDYQIGPVSYTNARTAFVTNIAVLGRIRNDYYEVFETLINGDR